METKKQDTHKYLVNQIKDLDDEIKDQKQKLQRLREQQIHLFKQAMCFVLKDFTIQNYFNNLILKLKNIAQGTKQRLTFEEEYKLENLNYFYLTAFDVNLLNIQEIKEKNFEKVATISNLNYDEILAQLEKKGIYHTDETDCFMKYYYDNNLKQKFLESLKGSNFMFGFNELEFKIDIISTITQKEIFKNLEKDFPDYEILKRIIIIKTNPNFKIQED